MWKVDFCRAFDSVAWSYLWEIMKRRGFPPKWIQWMKRCIATLSFFPLLSSRPCGAWIQPQRGVRQGCPLAPLIFNLAVDTLACFTCKLSAAGLVKGYSLSNSRALAPILQYADDTVFFVEGGKKEAKVLYTMVSMFGDISG
jgi:hypothetical protein